MASEKSFEPVIILYAGLGNQIHQRAVSLKAYIWHQLYALMLFLYLAEWDEARFQTAWVL